MKLLIDFFPILLFFITFKLYEDPKEGVLAATAVAIVATFVQVGITWLRQRKVEKMHLITLALIVVLGGATLLLEDEMFIKWKPTAVNWLFALVFWASHFIGSRPIVRRLMEKKDQLSQDELRRASGGMRGLGEPQVKPTENRDKVHGAMSGRTTKS